MKTKRAFSVMGILGLVMAFALTGCDLSPPSFTLLIQNTYTSSIGVRIYELQGTTTVLVRQAIAPAGQEGSFSLPEGSYRVLIPIHGIELTYPPDGFRPMRGTVRLTFNGITLDRN